MFWTMPIYEFHCDKCEKDSEVLVRSSNWKGTRCPHCGSTKLSKQLSVFASTVAAEGAPCCKGGACEVSPCATEAGSCGGCCGGGPHRH